MKKLQLLVCVVLVSSAFTACKKEGDTIINNYGSSESGSRPVPKLLKEYGSTDSSQILKFSYQNNEVAKLKELVLYASGVASARLVVMFNSSNQPEAFQVYSLPANTLSSQGTFKTDSKGRVIETIVRATNGDTTGISYFKYANSLASYQPSSFSHYDKSNNRTDRYEYYTYDSKGSITKVESYTDNGSDPLYKSSETNVETGSGINTITNLYYYIVLSGSSGGYTAYASQYFSSYFPVSTREQRYNASGSNAGMYINNYDYEVDADNNIQTLSQGLQKIIFKY